MREGGTAHNLQKKTLYERKELQGRSSRNPPQGIKKRKKVENQQPLDICKQGKREVAEETRGVMRPKKEQDGAKRNGKHGKNKVNPAAEHKRSNVRDRSWRDSCRHIKTSALTNVTSETCRKKR